MLFSAMQSQNNECWIDILQRIVYEYNIKFNRSINMSPSMAFKNNCGFNVRANVLYNDEQNNIVDLEEHEMN
jgi:hypothetical protein